MDMLGTLVITMGFARQAYDERWHGKTVRLHAIHGTLDETKAAYKEWLVNNPQLAVLVNATFEVKMAVHQDEL